MGNSIGPLIKSVSSNTNHKFWALQFGGWSAYAFITFLNITLLEGNVSWPHIAHLVMSATLGILITWPMRYIYRSVYGTDLVKVVSTVAATVIVFSGLWNVGRVLVYAWWVGDKPVWDEFNYWYYGSLSIFMTWSVMYFGTKSYDQLKEQNRQLEEEEKRRQQERYMRLQAESLARESQLKMLRYQLNPHFLFNTLNSISSLVHIQQNDSAQKMIHQLGDFLRYSLEQDESLQTTLQQELESIKLYLSIEQTRFQDRLVVDYEVEHEALGAYVPVLILQPIIENSIKYAIAMSERGGTIKVFARRVGEELELSVTDSGSQGEPKSEVSGRGVGLTNTLERLQNLYQDNYFFTTDHCVNGGFTTLIRIPFQLAVKKWVDQEQPAHAAAT